MKSLLDNESYQKKLAKQRLAQQRQFDRKLEKQKERLNDSAYMVAEKAKKYAAQRRQIERQQEKLKEKLSDPDYLLKQRAKQQEAVKKRQQKALLKTKSDSKPSDKKTTKATASKGMKGRSRTAEEKRLEQKLADIGCICCMNKGWYTQAMRETEGQRFISMHHVEGRTQPWAHAKQLPLCHFHHQTPPPKEAPEDLFPIHGNAIPVWEKVNGSQESLLKQAYEIIGEERPWLEC